MAIDVPDKILQEQHLQQINEGLDAITKVRKHIDMAERAGIDMTSTRQNVDSAEKQLRQLKQVYFPGR